MRSGGGILPPLPIVRKPPGRRQTGNVGVARYALTNTMTKKLLFVTTILLVVAFVAVAADVSGKWTYEAPGRGGNPGRPTTITLKADGMKLTGTVPGGGPGLGLTRFSDGSLDCIDSGYSNVGKRLVEGFTATGR